ncbi:hypothetical protein DH2020_005429 [Rehmannia glutinosa]|uniref:Importin N-terminal domain-containing protein n=1 Tax=Rehmannia glutinosa TaxID=99300 RepID=A0ABR0XFV6_REHGL
MAAVTGGGEASTWKPQEEGLREICALLEQQMAPSSDDKSMIWQRLQHYSQFPDFNNYLAFIFARGEGKSVEVRQAAGLLLKNNLRSAFKTMPPANQQYIKLELLPCMGAADKQIRSTAGTIISTFVQIAGVAGWPELLHALVKCLDSNDVNHMEGAMDALSKLFQSPHSTLRKLSLGSVNQYIMLMPTVLHLSMDKYLQGLFVLANDPAPDVRKLVCAAFVQLIEVRSAALEILLSNMAYADDDESLLEAEEDGSLPDRDQDLKPRFHSSRFHGSEDVEDEDDDIVNVWNLRKCSAAALDFLSNVFGDEILPILMPIVQANLSTTGDEAWKDREAAVLTLGAIGGIIAFLIPLLDDKFPLIRSITCWTLSRFSKYIVQVTAHQVGHDQFDKVLMGLLRRILDDNKRVQEAACSAFATLEEEAAEELGPRLEIILQHLMLAFGKYQRRNLRIVYDAIGTLADAVGGELNQPKYLEILMPPLIAKWQQLSDSDKDLFPLLECFTSIAQALGTGFSQFAQPVFQRCINCIQTQQLAKVDPVSAGAQYDKEFIVCSLDLLSGLTEGLGPGIESLVSQSNLRDLLLQCCMDDAYDVRQSAFALLGDLARVCPVHLHSRLLEFLDVAAKQLNTPKLKETVSVANNACWAIGELAVKVRKEMSPVVLTVISCLVPILQHPEGLNKSLIENSAITLGRLALVCPELVSPHMEHFMQPWCVALSMIRDDIEKEDAFRGLCAMVRANPSGALNSLVFMCKAIASWHVSDVLSYWWVIYPYANEVNVGSVFHLVLPSQEIRSEDLHNEVRQVLHGYKQADLFGSLFVKSNVRLFNS